MSRAVERLDVPLEPEVFRLNYLDAETLLDSVQSMLSERGLAHVDPRTNALVVSDLAARKDQIGQIVHALDTRLETRTYKLDYTEVDVVMERLQEVMPEEAVSVTTDEVTRQVSVTAIPARLEEVDGLIEAWDVKRRQVMIEAYLVSAETSVTRELGIDWSYFDEIAGVPFALQSGSTRPNYTTSPDSGYQRLSAGRWPHREFMRDILGRRYQYITDLNPTNPNDVANEAALDQANWEYILDPNSRAIA